MLSKLNQPIAELDITDAAVVSRYAEADLPTEYGLFRVIAYRQIASPSQEQDDSTENPGVNQTLQEHLAIVHGDVTGRSGVLTRVHSECLTGEVLRSLRCDCREQLDLALRRIAASDHGVVLYLRQEGRGIGLGNKLRAYALQDTGLDTVDANRHLGFADDLREYSIAAAMLADLQVISLRMLTNNPAKVAALMRDGVKVDERIAHIVPANTVNASYLQTKQARMGHLFSDRDILPKK